MKKWMFTAIATIALFSAQAQGTIIVNSEKIFKSIEAYNTAISSLDALAKQYQSQVDARFSEVERLYNNYQTIRASLSDAGRQAHEDAILRKEQEATDYQKSLFGENGSLMMRRIELIKPIQEQVFAVIASYAQKIGADAVIDSSNNPTLLYTAPQAERTQQIIDLLKQPITSNKLK